MAYQIELKVEPSVLRSTASEVTRLTKALGEKFNELQTIVANTSYYWVGAAGDQYRRDFAAQKDEADEILQFLRKYPTDLLSMAGIYEQAESINTQTLGSLPSDIL